MPTTRKKPSKTQRSHIKSAPNTRTKIKKAQVNNIAAIPSHLVGPAKPGSHFAGKHIDMERMRESTDFSGVMQITHDIKIGFNRFDMFQDRFEKQKQVVRNNNFKLICGTQYKSNNVVKAE